MTTRSVSGWEQRFNSWSVGPGITEQQRCENAEHMVRDAIRAHSAFKGRDITVFLQGSYRNRTNVRMDSDIDVCVLCKDTFYFDFELVPDLTTQALGFSPATYDFDELKQDVEDALVAKFGRRAVTPGDKAFDIKDNTYRVAADVVPTFENRVYYRDYLNGLSYHSGTTLRSGRTGTLITNWPEQHYQNGIQKHTDTARQFKKKVRCLKNLANEMAEEGINSAKGMASFLLESLVFNCSREAFNQSSHYDGMQNVIAQSWHATVSDEAATDMVEVNNIKYLFRPSQPWKISDVHAFLLDAWQYVGFGS